MNYYAAKYKECSPEKTIEKIRSILSENDIQVEEEWSGENELGTFSLRVHVKGCEAVGSNGKGTTKEYARASAYAEFMERIQNMMLTSSQVLPTVEVDKNAGFVICKEEKYLTAEEIIDENSSFIQMYMEDRGLANGTRQEKINAFLKLERMDFYLFHKYNRFLSIPFFSILENKYVYLPYFSYRVYYGSNGMSAGNTPEEALVQALSEVFERVVNKKTIFEALSFPEIPDSFIKENYPEIFEYVEILRKTNRIKTIIKDCTCNGKYPVVGVYFIDQNTGYYGVKFGAHPNLGIALERCFTEATQGLTVEEFTKKALIDFQNIDVDTSKNLLNGFRTSDCKYNYKIFSDKHQYKYFELKNYDSLGNKETLVSMIKSLTDIKCDVLIRDASYFGLPTYHVIVPTVSETERRSDKDIDKYHDIFLARALTLNVSKVTDENLVRFANALAYAGKRSGSSILSDLTGTEYPYPASEYHMDMIYLYAMCHFAYGNYTLARDGMKVICDNKPKGKGEIYDAIYHFFSGLCEINDYKEVMNYIRIFYDEEICEKLEDLFSDRKKVLLKQYPQMEDNSELYRKYSTKSDIINHIYTKYVEKQITSDYTLDSLVRVIQGLNLQASGKGQ